MRQRKHPGQETPEQSLRRLASATPHAPSVVESQWDRWRDPNRIGNICGACLFFGGFLLFFFPGSFLPWSDLTASAPGVVVAFDQAEQCLPTVQYEVDGVTHEAEPDLFTTPCAFEMAGDATVRYDPRRPYDSEVLPNGWSLWGFTVIPLVLLGVGMLAGVVYVLLSIPGWWHSRPLRPSQR